MKKIHTCWSPAVITSLPRYFITWGGFRQPNRGSMGPECPSKSCKTKPWSCPLISNATWKTKHATIWPANHRYKPLQILRVFWYNSIKNEQWIKKKKKKKESQDLQNKTSWHKTHPIPIPFLWVSSVRCFKSVPTATVRSGGILLLLYLFISMVFKPCTELAVGLRKRVIKALAWRCFVLLFNAILSVPAAGCSSFCSQALQTKCLG